MLDQPGSGEALRLQGIPARIDTEAWAGAAGDFGLVVGVDRGAGADALTEAGAGIVVTDLAQLLPDEATR